MKKILVVSHDAGGANILASLIKKYRQDFNWVSCVFGPAKDIFLKKEIIPLFSVKKRNPKKILESVNPDLVLTGTGWGSDIEINFIKAAEKNKIKTASFLDHWVNYRERFGYPGKWKMNLPDFIFIGDKWAYKIALENKFPKDILFQVENPYFEEIIKESKEVKQKKIRNSQNKRTRILYMSEPISSHALKKHNNLSYFGYTEYEVVKNLLKIIKSQKAKSQLELKIRLHPAEKINKYSNLLKRKTYNGIRKLILISEPNKNSLVKDCLWADIVIGSGSMALFIAFLIRKKAISYIPGHKQTFSFPQKKIIKVRSMDYLMRKLKYFKNNQPKAGKKTYPLTSESFKNALYKIIN